MKNIFFLVVFVFCAGTAFSCEYNEKTHELIECKEYKKGSEEIKEECRLAHNAYNRYVAAKVAAKAKQKATRIGNKISKFIGEKLDERDASDSE